MIQVFGAADVGKMIETLAEKQKLKDFNEWLIEHGF